MTSTSSPKPAPRPKHWLLAKSRQWHTWGGLFAALFLLVVAASGIVLNYKKPVFRALGLEGKPRTDMAASRSGPPPPALRLTTGAGVDSLPVGIGRALALAREAWGDVPLERLELKAEHGRLTYKLKRKDGGELWVDAASGEHFLKGEYEKLGRAGAGGERTRQTDWGKILIDLHTGKLGGEAGKAIMSLAALVLLFLTVSGVYLWLKPILIRRRHAAERALAATPATPATPATAASVAPRPAGARAPGRELAGV